MGAKAQATRRATPAKPAKAKTGRVAKVARAAKNVAAKVRSPGKRKAQAGDGYIGRDVIGQYRITQKLGAGGMGAVYLAEQISIGRRAVIKVLHQRLLGSPESAERFAIEAKAASNLEHPNIVTIYNFGAMGPSSEGGDDGVPFLAMEYLEGRTLEAVLAEHKHGMPLERAMPIAMQICSALAEAHRRGVVHRDLKPSNVMLVERAGMSDFVKVLDFGIAKVDGANVTTTGEVFGTPRYMSPEQLRGAPLDGRSDLYATALLVYEMLCGASPFQSDTPQGWMFQHISDPPPSMSERNRKAQVPPAVEAVVLRALGKTPDERPPTMDDFARELDAAARMPVVPIAVAAPAPVEHHAAPVLAAIPPSHQLPRIEPPIAGPATPKSQRTSWRWPWRRAPQRESWLARIARPFRRRQQQKGWRGFVASKRGRITIAASAAALLLIVAIALSAGDSPAAAAAAAPGAATTPTEPTKLEPSPSPSTAHTAPTTPAGKSTTKKPAKPAAKPKPKSL